MARRSEVKRFIEQIDIHLPFLLRVASAPADVDDSILAALNEDCEIELDDDNEVEITDADIAAEEELEPTMIGLLGRHPCDGPTAATVPTSLQSKTLSTHR